MRICITQSDGSALEREDNVISFPTDIARNQDRLARFRSGGAAKDLASREAGLMVRLDLAAPKHHAGVIADAIREGARLSRASVSGVRPRSMRS
jgi:hypothetical protein